MEENRATHLVDIPFGGRGGIVWNRLHDERESVCEVMLNDTTSKDCRGHHQELLHSRLRLIDEALDRLMSGSYGLCSKCGHLIPDSIVEVDATTSVCLNCSEPDRPNNQPRQETMLTTASNAEVLINHLNAFDTILLNSQNSQYRIFLLNPYTGRALIEGGQYLSEPTEGRVLGSQLSKTEFKHGSIQAGSRLEMWTDGKVVLTSPVKSFEVKHNVPAESFANLVSALH